MLGDRGALDVLRVDTAAGHCEFLTAMASWGFMGDLMKCSERLRWMGPARYEVGSCPALEYPEVAFLAAQQIPAILRDVAPCSAGSRRLGLVEEQKVHRHRFVSTCSRLRCNVSVLP